MGGTTAKACVIDHGQPAINYDRFHLARLHRCSRGADDRSGCDRGLGLRERTEEATLYITELHEGLAAREALLLSGMAYEYRLLKQ